MKRATAAQIGVVIHRPSGQVARIFNPDWDWQLDQHHVGPDEFMIRVNKDEWGISRARNGMTAEQAFRIQTVLGA